MVAARRQIGPHSPRHLNCQLHVHVDAVARHAQNFCRHPCRKDFRRLEQQRVRMIHNFVLSERTFCLFVHNKAAADATLFLASILRRTPVDARLSEHIT